MLTRYYLDGFTEVARVLDGSFIEVAIVLAWLERSILLSDKEQW